MIVRWKRRIGIPGQSQKTTGMLMFRCFGLAAVIVMLIGDVALDSSLLPTFMVVLVSITLTALLVTAYPTRRCVANIPSACASRRLRRQLRRR